MELVYRKIILISQNVFFEAIQNGSKSNRILHAWIEVCHQIFGDWEVQTMWNFSEECDVYKEAHFSQNVFTEGLNCLKKYEIVFNIKTGQAYLKCWIQFMCSFWPTEEDISEQLEISVGTAHKIVYYDLTFSKVNCLGFYQENARLHTAGRTVEAISQLPHLPYHTGLAPSDFHVFSQSFK